MLSHMLKTTTGLKVKNSMKPKEIIPFVEKTPGVVNWYICGPTVYAPSHVGHARAYLTFDIIRGIMEEYFGYNVSYCMNITDIDDKIIKRTRENHFFDTWNEKYSKPSEEARKDVKSAAEYEIEGKKNKVTELELAIKNGEKDEEETTSMINLLKKQQDEAKELISKIMSAKDSKTWSEIVTMSRGVLSKYLDRKFMTEGKDELPNDLFEKLPRKFEKQFFEDMQALGVKPPNVITRVSEYLPDILRYVEKIIENGFGYESNGSVYFDTQKFKKSHNYRKLVPATETSEKEAAELLADGEGSLESGEKRHAYDFALWKASKRGEPKWESPWGKGRPGWHIECSVMASAVFGENMDIHSGGIDLRFPHHDNEMAQAEAYVLFFYSYLVYISHVNTTTTTFNRYFQNHQWVNYWFHAGHLHIEGLKMSKSLKNFISIRQAIDKKNGSTTPRRLRILFLLNAWDAPLNFSMDQLEQAKAIEQRFTTFFNSVKKELRRNDAPMSKRWNEDTKEHELWQLLQKVQASIHTSLQDNFKTQQCIVLLQDLTVKTCKYISDAEAKNKVAQGYLLIQIATYVTKIFTAFGLIGRRNGDDWLLEKESATAAHGLGYRSSDSGSNKEATLRPMVKALCEFRKKVRETAFECDKKSALLKMCDEVRAKLLDEGIQLLDQGSEDHKSESFYFMSKDEIEQVKRDREKRRQKEEAKAKAKAEREAAAKKAASIKMVEPERYFTDDEEQKVKYSKFDDKGMPTHLANGDELNKSQQKKCKKVLKVYTKKYAKWKKSQS